jgi:hypothetical protein
MAKRSKGRRTSPGPPLPLHSTVEAPEFRFAVRTTIDQPTATPDASPTEEAEPLPRTTFVFHVPEPFAGFDWTLSHDKKRLVRGICCARVGCQCDARRGAITEICVNPGDPEPDYDAACREARERWLLMMYR